MKSSPMLGGIVFVTLLFTAWPGAAQSNEGVEKHPASEGAHSPTQIQGALKREPNNPKLYIELGRAYWDENDYEKAFDAFQQAVKIAPASAEAHNWLGAFLMGRGNLPSAISELRKATSLDRSYARAYTNLGSALAKSGDVSEAVPAFQRALALEPNSWAAHLNLALALREAGDTQGSLAQFRRVVMAVPKNPTIQCELGQTLRQSGDLTGAIRAFERALELDPELREAYYGLGFTLKQQAAAAHKATPHLAGPADELYRRAQDRVAKGDLPAAKDELLEAVRVDPSHGDAENLLGWVIGQQGDISSSLQHLERAVRLRSDSAEVHYNYGAALWYSGSQDKALAELKTSIAIDPASAATYALLGMALRETGDLEGARSNLLRAIALSPTTAANLVDLGIVFIRNGAVEKGLRQIQGGLNARSSFPMPDWDAAIAAVGEVIAKGPNSAEAHNILALMLGRKGADSAEVFAELREAIRLRPNYAEAHNNLGLVLAQNGDDEKAIAAFREAVRDQPDYAEAHANLGAALMLSDVEQAIVELEKAVALDPSSTTAQFNLAEAYGSSPTHGSAKQIEQLQKLISIAPDFARAHLALGKAFLHEGKPDLAVTELEQATRLDTSSGEAHYQLGLALARIGKQQDATVELKKGRDLSSAEEQNQNATLDLSEGRAALEKGELEEAEAKFRHAIKLLPNSSIAERYLGVVLEKKGDRPGALDAYQKALNLSPADATSRQSLDRLSSPENPKPAGKLENGVEDNPAKVAELEDYFRQSRFQQVEPLLADYVKQHPSSSWGWYALGYSQFAQKKIGPSIQSLAESLRLKVENGDAHKILGRDLMIIGRFDAAQTEFEQGIHYAPNSAENYYDLGKLFSLQENWEQARSQFEQALRIDANYLEAIDALGFALEALGNDAEAVRNYEKAIALNDQQHGKFVSAHVSLSAYYERNNNSEKALEYAERALALDPKCDPAWFQKARAEERQGHLDGAVNSLNRAISLNPRSASYYYVLAGVYRRLGKMQESKQALDSFSRLDQQSNELEKMRRNVSRTRVQPHPGGERE